VVGPRRAAGSLPPPIIVNPLFEAAVEIQAFCAVAEATPGSTRL
jgi:hypothetical protein